MKLKLAETAEELDALHLALAQFARMLWDAQAGRVAVGNRIKTVEQTRIGETPLGEEVVKALYDVAQSFEEAERKCQVNVRRCVRAHPLAPWIEAQRGIGLDSFANLLGVTGPLDRFETVSKLWKYLGLHVTPAGTAPKPKKGEAWTHTDCTFDHLRKCKEDCKTNHHPSCVVGGVGTAYSPKGRVVCHLIGSMGIGRQSREDGGPYRAAYDAKKAYYEAERPDWPQIRRHNAALRYAVKAFVKALWIEWHRHFKTGQVEAWEARERERAAKAVVISIEGMPPTPEPARYDYALPVGAR